MDLRDALQQRGAGRRASRVRPGDLFVFDGGLNLVDPPILMAPGQLLGVKNYEPGVRGGYERVEGYERFDGRASPTRANYWTLQVAGVVGAPFLPGDLLNQTLPGQSARVASGTIAHTHDLGGGAWAVAVVQDRDTPGFDDFVSEGDVYTSSARVSPGTRRGTSTSAFRNGASEDAINDDIVAAKTELLRSRIGPVGGTVCSGPVRGVAILRDKIIAWRDRADGAAGLMFETTDDPFSGWRAVPLGHTLAFTAGATEPKSGDVLTGSTSGATLTVGQVASSDGSWASATASGTISLTAVTGTPVAGETLMLAPAPAAPAMTVTSVTANALPPGGTYRSRVRNFYGVGDRQALYAVNGVGLAFEYDGTAFTFIDPGMPTFPTHVFVINDHLGLCFPGGSIQNSGYQRPLSWTPVTGADERSVGGTVTEVIEETTNVVFIATRQQTFAFSGQVMENFRLDIFSPETGMLPGTAARLGQTIYLDDRGFTTLRQSQAFGNFTTNSISDKILPLVQTLLAGNGVVGAVISRRKNLYRCVFTSGTALVISTRPGNRLSGWTLVDYSCRPTCLVSGEVEGPVGFIPGERPGVGPLFPERVFMGAQDGYVYECDIGNSFDGGAIEHFARFTYHNSRSPDTFKHYRKAVIDVDVNGVTTLYATVDFNYGNRSGQAGELVEFLGGGGLWDVANWDEFKWSGQAFDQVVLKVEGDGYNIGLYFYGSSHREATHTLYNCTLHHSTRRINRGSQGD